MTDWRLIPHQEYTAAMNMALDEAVMTGIKHGTSPPTIRFYTWKPKAITIGYFQGIAYEVDRIACKNNGIDVVRRITGGGAVFHDDEITYSIIGPEHLFSSDILKSYEEICRHLIDALATIGITAHFSPINDILVGEKKISGNAQTRRQGILLQHGTLLYRVDVDTMFTLLTVGKEKMADKLIESVKKRVTSVSEIAPLVKKEHVIAALEKSFSRNKKITSDSFTPEEINHAYTLAKEKYSTEQWNAQR